MNYFRHNRLSFYVTLYTRMGTENIIMRNSRIIFIPIVLLGTLATIHAFSCPEKYQKFSMEHTFCKQCCGCKLISQGIDSNLQEKILHVHNEFRRRVAGGFHGDSTSHLPRASRMLQLFWDDELADLAQKWANTCPENKGNDCELCRMVERFPVGQQSFEYDYKMSGDDLQTDFWSYLKKLEQMSIQEISNFTGNHHLFAQLLWGKTYRIGCGFAYFEKNGKKKSVLVCNYGPEGSIQGKEIYKFGEPCTACPENTCCGNGCKMFGEVGPYNALCKLIDDRLPPDGNHPHVKVGDEIFFCSFKGESDCAYTVDGVDRWHSNITTGSWLRTTLKRRENSTLIFTSPIRTKSGELCIRIRTRSGPTEADEVYLYNMTARLERQEFDIYYSNIKFPPPSESLRHRFHTDYIRPRKVPEDQDMKFSVTFSVPKESDVQYFDIDEIVAEEGKCSKVTTEQYSKLRKAECE